MKELIVSCNMCQKANVIPVTNPRIVIFGVRWIPLDSVKDTDLCEACFDTVTKFVAPSNLKGN